MFKIYSALVYRCALVFTCAVCVAGCTTVVPKEVNSNRLEGKVWFVAYLENFDAYIDWDVALAESRQRCQTFGFKDAAAMEGMRKKCVATYTYEGTGGCSSWEYERIYQCTNQPPKDIVQ